MKTWQARKRLRGRPLSVPACRGSKGRERRRWQMASRLGFTLVELLVAVAVIGILAGLLLPALSKSKAQAQQVVCVNSFKQLTACWRMYSG